MKPTHPVPTTRHRSRLSPLDKVARVARPEVRPRLHQRLVAFQIPQRKRIVEPRRLGKVQRAGGSILAVVGIQQGEKVVRLTNG